MRMGALSDLYFLHQQSHLFGPRQLALQFIGQRRDHAVAGNADGFVGIAQCVLDHRPVLLPAEDDADGRVFAVQSDRIVEHRQLELHLADVFRQELSHLKFHGDQAF